MTAQARDRYELQPIGYVRTRYLNLEETPIQTFKDPAGEAWVEVIEKYRPGLMGLEDFDYAHLLTFLDRMGPFDRGQVAERLQPVPFMLQGSGRRVGVFASRFPMRPNALGLSLVRLLGVAEGRVLFRGVDMLDGTPVLDIKPWEPHIDVPAYQGGTWLDGIGCGWYQSLDPGSAQPLAGSQSLAESGLLYPASQVDEEV